MNEFTQENKRMLLLLYKTNKDIDQIAINLKKPKDEIIYNIGLIIANGLKNGKTYEQLAEKLHSTTNDIIKIYNDYEMYLQNNIKIQINEPKTKKKISKKEIDEIINIYKDENEILDIIIKNKKLKEEIKNYINDNNIKQILEQYNIQ